MTQVRSEGALSLRVRAVSASAWTILGSLASHTIRLLSNLILTRLLFPEAFGLMTIAATVVVIVSMLSDVGIRQGIVRGVRGNEPEYLDTAWSLQICRGFALWAAACCAAIGLHLAVRWGWVPPESTYAHPLLPWVIAVSSFGASIIGFQATDIATADRTLNLKPLVMLELGTQFAGVLLMIMLAWQMRTVWALVIGGLAANLAWTLLSHRVFRYHRNRFRFDKASLADLLLFGKWVAASSAISVFVSQGDRLILGALVSPEVLGLFSIAIGLAGALDQVLQRVFSSVMLPVLSELARERANRLPEAFYRLRWRVDPTMLFLSGALFAIGPSVIATLYDSRYHEAGNMLQILSLMLVTSRFSMVQQVYLALNEPRNQVALNVVRLATLVVAVPLAYRALGPTGALVAVALRDLPSVPLIFWFNSRHGLNRFELEFVWLVFWPIGWGLGSVAVAIL